MNYQAPNVEGSDAIKELRKKYGFALYAEEGTRGEDSRNGVGAQRNEYGNRFERARDIVDRYYDEGPRIGGGFRGQQAQTRNRSFVPEESLGSVGYDKIKRFADDEALKCRGGFK
jgi:hypothetical protein